MKRSAADDLIGAICIVARGGVHIDPQLGVRIVSDLVCKPHAGASFRMDDINGTGNALRESDGLRRVAQGYSQKEIAAQLGVSVKTVETYKARAQEKLGLDSRVGIMRYAIEQDWLGDGTNGASQGASALPPEEGL